MTKPTLCFPFSRAGGGHVYSWCICTHKSGRLRRQRKGVHISLAVGESGTGLCRVKPFVSTEKHEKAYRRETWTGDESFSPEALCLSFCLSFFFYILHCPAGLQTVPYSFPSTVHFLLPLQSHTRALWLENRSTFAWLGKGDNLGVFYPIGPEVTSYGRLSGWVRFAAGEACGVMLP